MVRKEEGMERHWLGSLLVRLVEVLLSIIYPHDDWLKIQLWVVPSLRSHSRVSGCPSRSDKKKGKRVGTRPIHDDRSASFLLTMVVVERMVSPKGLILK